MNLNHHIKVGSGRPETDWEAALREAPRSMKELADFSTGHEALAQSMAAAMEHLLWEEDCLVSEARREAVDSIQEILSEWPDDAQREVEIAMVWANCDETCFGHLQWAADIRARLHRAHVDALRHAASGNVCNLADFRKP